MSDRSGTLATAFKQHRMLGSGPQMVFLEWCKRQGQAAERHTWTHPKTATCSQRCDTEGHVTACGKELQGRPSMGADSVNYSFLDA